MNVIRNLVAGQIFSKIQKVKLLSAIKKHTKPTTVHVTLLRDTRKTNSVYNELFISSKRTTTPHINTLECTEKMLHAID